MGFIKVASVSMWSQNKHLFGLNKKVLSFLTKESFNSFLTFSNPHIPWACFNTDYNCLHCGLKLPQYIYVHLFCMKGNSTPLKFLADTGGAAFPLPNRHLIIKLNMSTIYTLSVTTYITTVESVKSSKFLEGPEGPHKGPQYHLPGQYRPAVPLLPVV